MREGAREDRQCRRRQRDADRDESEQVRITSRERMRTIRANNASLAQLKHVKRSESGSQRSARLPTERTSIAILENGFFSANECNRNSRALRFR